MSVPEDRLVRNEAVESAAAEWLVKHDRGLTPQQQDEFLQWLAASPAHRESFQRHQAMWGEFDGLAQWRPEHSAEPNPDLLARPRRPRPLARWVTPILAAAAIAVAALMWWERPASLSPPATAPVAFDVASYRQEVLPDGSIIDLNGGARLVVQFSAAERRVHLLHGEAQFTVAKNPARPFIVSARGVDVRAVGTAFSVKLLADNLEVLVTEGSVQVAQPTAELMPTSPNHGTGEPPPSVLAELSAGQRTTIPMMSAMAPAIVVPASPQEIEQLLQWKPRLLDFDFTPLAQVVETFNRSNTLRLVVADPELQTLPIVASIRSDNVEGFVRLLEATMGVRAERRTDGEIVLYRQR